MDELDLYNHCTYLNELFSIPIHIKNKKIDYSIPRRWQTYEPSFLYDFSISKPTYFVTYESLYYGIIFIKEIETTIYVGPVADIALGKSDIRQFELGKEIQYDDLEVFINILEKSKKYTFNYFLYILTCINFLLNKEKIDITEITKLNTKIEININQLLIRKTVNFKEEENFHDTFKFEQKYTRCVERGDLNGFYSLIKDSPDIKPGILADNNLRHTKNLFIASMTLITRAAIKGGMDIETAYVLSDISIREMEKLNHPEEINQLARETIVTLIKRVAKNKIPKGTSPMMVDILQYISNHLNTRLTVNQVALHFSLNRSYLSRIFKEQLGVSLSKYIESQKIEEAKELLEYSPMTVDEISSYLCFSSQSHFQTVFKKLEKVTPLVFKKKCHK